jgi:thiol-disulfide isomerase/thioredoxin
VTPVLVLLATLTAATAAGVLWRRRNGQVREAAGQRIDADELRRLGGEPGERATLVQFSSAFCAPCRATRRILGEVAELVPGVAYVEVDAESHLDAVRRHSILRTPTTLVLDDVGRVVVRASGQPRKADVIAALGRAVAESTTTKRIT